MKTERDHIIEQMNALIHEQNKAVFARDYAKAEQVVNEYLTLTNSVIRLLKENNERLALHIRYKAESRRHLRIVR